MVRIQPPEGRAYMAGVMLDITERKGAEQALRDSEGRYRELFEANPQPMWVYDLDTLAFLAVNDAAIARYGYSRDEFLTLTIADIRPVEDVPALLNNLTRVSGGLDQAGYWRHRLKDGTLIDVEITSHTLDFNDRRAELVLAIDVTERLHAEVVQHESRRELEQRVAERTEELRLANEQLEQRVRERTLELLDANARLQEEIDVRAHAESEAQQASRALGETNAQLEEEIEERRRAESDALQANQALVESNARLEEEVEERRRAETALRESQAELQRVRTACRCCWRISTRIFAASSPTWRTPSGLAGSLRTSSASAWTRFSRAGLRSRAAVFRTGSLRPAGAL